MSAMQTASRRLSGAEIGALAESLAADCAFLARALEAAGPPPLRHQPAGFATLARAICAQQVSTASARAIMGRVLAAIDPLTPDQTLTWNVEGLRGLGLSRPKATYFLDLAEACASGRLDLRRLSRLDDEAAIAVLVQVRGIGRWTAEVYLLFALRRPDIWPVDDLAIVQGVRRLMNLPEPPDKKTLMEIGERWRPYRSIAARLIYNFYSNAPV